METVRTEEEDKGRHPAIDVSTLFVSTNILKTQDGVLLLVLSRKTPWPLHFKA